MGHDENRNFVQHLAFPKTRCARYAFVKPVSIYLPSIMFYLQVPISVRSAPISVFNYPEAYHTTPIEGGGGYARGRVGCIMHHLLLTLK
jgi:hypothetical protein